jgi:hypothetical protein
LLNTNEKFIQRKSILEAKNDEKTLGTPIAIPEYNQKLFSLTKNMKTQAKTSVKTVK